MDLNWSTGLVAKWIPIWLPLIPVRLPLWLPSWLPVWLPIRLPIIPIRIPIWLPIWLPVVPVRLPNWLPLWLPIWIPIWLLIWLPIRLPVIPVGFPVWLPLCFPFWLPVIPVWLPIRFPVIPVWLPVWMPIRPPVRLPAWLPVWHPIIADWINILDQVFRLIYGFGLDHCWNWIFQFGRQFCGSGMDDGQWTTDNGQWTTIWKPFWMPFRNNHLAAMVCLGFMQNRGMPRMIIEHLQHMKASYFIRSLSIRFHYAACAIAFKSISKFLQSAFVKSLSRLTSNTFFFFAFSLMMFNVFNASRLV